MKNDSCVVLLNSAIAKIYSFDKKEKKLTLLSEEVHPSSAAKDYDLVSDELGNYQKTNSYNQGTYSPNKTPKEIEAEKFASILADLIEEKSSKFKGLYIFSPAKFGHLLSTKLNKSVIDKIISLEHKDYTKLHHDDLEEKIIPFLIYPGNKSNKI